MSLLDRNLESILNQTFNDEYNTIANRAISNSEKKNVEDVFKNINNIEECLICCDNDKVCIKCFKCTAFYCKACLIKIASDFNKCSTCGVTIKNNYKILTDYNQELQDTLQYEKAIANSLNEYISKKPIVPSRPNRPDRPDRPDNLNSKIKTIKQKTTIFETSPSYNSNHEENHDHEENHENINIKKNKKPIKKFSIFNNNNNNTDTDNYNDNENNDNNINNILENKKKYIEDLKNDKIYNIKFTSYINIISSTTPNYSYDWNHTNKTLTFYVLCNDNNDFVNIVVNYNILKASFQSILYLWLNEIVKCPFSIFKVKWNKLSDKINKFSQKQENNITSQDIKKITKDIENICKK